jgi:aminoglycoside phosphotransferase (APT) family kinase protein
MSDSNLDKLDSPTDVREGEELDVDCLGVWLRDEHPELAGEIDVLQFPAGHSNLTYLIRIDGREFVLRRPPHGAHVKSGHDMSREWRVLSALQGHYDKVPGPVAYCEDDEVIGAPFYLMERVEGAVLRGAEPVGFDLDAATMEGLSESFVEELATLHGIDWRDAGLEGFGDPQGYVDRQVVGWIDRYSKSRTDEIEEMEEVGKWLKTNRPETDPEDRGAALIHNDFKYDNLVLNPAELSEVRAVLDWEMATIGDPLMDLGTTLAYWVEDDDPDVLLTMQFGPTAMDGNFTRRELVDAYAERTGRDVSDILFYYVYGLYKVAVIGQQIYYRFEQGHTDDPRFAALIHAVRAMASMAVRALERDSI